MLHRACVVAVREEIGEDGTIGWDDAVAVLDGAFEGAIPTSRLPDTLLRAVHEEVGPLVELPGRRLGDAGVLVARLVLTHRLTAEEIQSDTLTLGADLAAFEHLGAIDGGLHSADGVPLRHRRHRVSGTTPASRGRSVHELVGPPGWLDSFSAGAIVAARAELGILDLRVVAESELTALPGDLGSVTKCLVAELTSDDGYPVPVSEVQLVLAADHPDWLAELRRPFSELLGACEEVELDHGWVGPPGCWERTEELDAIVATMTRHELDEEATDTLLDAVRAFADARAGRSPSVSAATVAAGLQRHWEGADALVDELRLRGAGPEQLREFASWLDRPSGGSARAIARWLEARAAAIDGAPLEAERLLGQAMDVDGWFGPALSDAAWCASDRGRARDAVNLLHRVCQPHDPRLTALREFAELQAPSVGRNAPCPCGSGRKFKQCHLGRPEVPEGAAVRWLLDKARSYVVLVAPPELIEDIAGADDEMTGGTVVGLDVLLFESGWLERFIADRGPLLPERDRTWATAWVTGQVCDVFRVAAVAPDGTVAVDGLISGRTYTVQPSAAMEIAAPDLLVWTRLVPVGDRWFTTGVARTVRLSERDELCRRVRADAGAPEDRVQALLGRRDLRLQNTSGDPLVLCSTSFETIDGAAVAAALDSALGPRDVDAEDVWTIVESTPGMDNAVRATLRLDGSVLWVETNSLARHDAALIRLAAVVGPLAGAPLDDTRVPGLRARALWEDERLLDAAIEAVGARAGLDIDDVDDVDDDDNESAALLDQFHREQEARWLDRPLAVLGGASPRAAAADPALVADLRTLLAEVAAGPAGFDADHLRAELGLA